MYMVPCLLYEHKDTQKTISFRRQNSCCWEMLQGRRTRVGQLPASTKTPRSGHLAADGTTTSAAIVAGVMAACRHMTTR